MIFKNWNKLYSVFILVVFIEIWICVNEKNPTITKSEKWLYEI